MLLYIAIPVIIIVYTILYWRKKGALHGIPGPKGLPLVGNALQLDKEKPHVQLAGLAKKYGHVFGLNLFGTPVIVVDGSKPLNDMLVTKGKDFAGRPQAFRVEKYTDNFSDVGFCEPTERWKLLKRMQMNQVKAYGSGRGRIESIVCSIGMEMVTKLKELSKTGDPVSLDNVLELSVTHMVYTLIHNRRAETEEEIKNTLDVVLLLHEAMDIGGSGEWLDIFPWLRFFGLKCWRALQDMHRLRWKIYGEWKEKLLHDQAHGVDVGRSMIYQLLEVKSKESGVDETCVQYVAWQMFLAGVSTTRSNLSCLFNVLVHYPDVQRKLQSEVDEVVGTGEVNLDARQHMHFHQATIHEMLRYASVVPFLLAHKTLVPSVLNGIHIPKGVMIWPNVWSLHHDESLWEEPFKFIPDRFLDSDGKLVSSDHPNRINLLPFGAGTRVCSGELFALSRMFLILAMMVQHFDILPATVIEAQPSCHPLDMLNGTIMHNRPYKVVLKARQ